MSEITPIDLLHQRLDKLGHDLAECKNCQAARYDALVNKIDDRMDEFKSLLSEVAQGHAVMITTQQEHEKKIQFLNDEWRRIVNERSQVEHTLKRVEQLLDKYDLAVMSNNIEKVERATTKNGQDIFALQQQPGKKWERAVNWASNIMTAILTGIVIWLISGD